MSILSFETPKKLRSTEEHANTYSSDCGVPGTYVPNMSYEDRLKWKAKKIGGEGQRVEIRKSIGGVQMLIVVRPNMVQMSMNGKAYFDNDEFAELQQAVEEARAVLRGEE